MALESEGGGEYLAVSEFARSADATYDAVGGTALWDATKEMVDATLGGGVVPWSV